MTLNTLKRKILPYALALGIFGSSLMNYSCIPVRAEESKKIGQVSSKNTQETNNYEVFVRSPGQNKYDGSAYSDSDASCPECTYVKDGKKHFSEEATINNIIKDDGLVEFGISKQAFNYADTNQCNLVPALFGYSTDGKAAYSSEYIGDIDGNHATIKTNGNDVDNLYVAVLCDNVKEGYTERLASFPVKRAESKQYSNKKNNQVSKETKPTLYDIVNQSKIPIITNHSNLQNENNLQNDIDETQESQENKTQNHKVTETTSEIPEYKVVENINNEYHLRTNCGTVNSYTNVFGNKMPEDKYGEITISEPKQCNIYLDEKDNTIKENYSIEPEDIRGNVLHTLSSDDKNLTLEFREPGEYSLIVGTTKYPTEQDILIFNVEKPEIKLNAIGNLSANLPKKTLEELLYNKDKFNGEIRVKPFLRKRVNVVEEPAYKGQKTLNQMLEEENRNYIPYVRLHQGNSLELEVNNTDSITYTPQLYKISGFGKNGELVLDKVNLKQSKLDKNRFKITDKGKLYAEGSNLDGKVVFPYNQSKVGAYDNLSGNLYLYNLVGTDKNGNVEDIDAVIVEVVANLMKEKAKGFAAGIPIGALLYYYTGNSLANMPIDHEQLLQIISNGTKTGGNIPQ